MNPTLFEAMLEIGVAIVMVAVTVVIFRGPRCLAAYDADGTPKEEDEKRAV